MSRDFRKLEGSQHSTAVAGEAAKAIRALTDQIESMRQSFRHEIDSLEARFGEHVSRLEEILKDFETIDNLVRRGYYDQRPLIEIVPQLRQAVENLSREIEALKRDAEDDKRRRDDSRDTWIVRIPKSPKAVLQLILIGILGTLALGALLSYAPEILNFIGKIMRPH